MAVATLASAPMLTLLVAVLVVPVLVNAEMAVHCTTSCSVAGDIRPVVLAAAATGEAVVVSGGPYLGPCATIVLNQTLGPVNITGVGGVLIACGNTGPLLSVNHTGGNITLAGFNISNCRHGPLGGCIEVSYSTLNLADMTFSHSSTAVSFLGVARNQNVGLPRYSIFVVRCVFVNGTATSNLDASFTLSGAGLAVFNAYRILVRNSRFESCHADDDGAGFATRSDSINPIVAEFYDSSFTNLTSVSSSGAIFVRSGRQDALDAITVSRCAFLQNTAAAGAGLSYQTAYGNMTVSDSIFCYNQANYGSHVRMLGAFGTIRNCIFENGQSYEGAVALESNGNLAVSSFIFNSTFTSNAATTCGILTMDGTPLKMDLCTFDSNFAPVHLINFPGSSNWTRLRYMNNRGISNVQISFQPLVLSLVLDTCVFFGNIGPLINYIFGSTTPAWVSNTIFYNNTSPPGLFTTFTANGQNVQNPNMIYFTNSTFMNNNNFNGTYGAALVLKNVNARISNVEFVNNTGKSGGGLYMEGINTALDILNCTFLGNWAENGGALYTSVGVRRVNISNTLFDSNSGSTRGGAIALGPLSNANSSRFDCNNCTLRNNVALGALGGAFSNYFSALPTFYDSLFEFNTAMLGGAVHIVNSNPPYVNASLTLVRCMLRFNVASNGGGAIALVNGASISLLQSTVVYNTATSSQGSAINCNQRPIIPLVSSQSFITHHAYAAVVGCDVAGSYPGYPIPSCGACDFGNINLSMGTCVCSSPDIPGPNCTLNSPGYSSTWFVDEQTGADYYNNGTSPVSAFATLAKALEVAAKGDRIFVTGSLTPTNVSKAVTITALGAAVLACDGLVWGLGYSVSPSDGPRVEGFYIRGCQLVVTAGTVTFAGGVLGGNPYGPLLTFSGGSVVLKSMIWGGDGTPGQLALTISGANGNLTMLNVTAPADGALRSVDVTRTGLNVTDCVFRGLIGETLVSTTLGAASFTRTTIEDSNFVGDCSSPMRCVALALRGDAYLSRCTIQNNVGAGVAVSGSGVRVTLDQTMLYNLTSNAGGTGLRVLNGALATLRASSIEIATSPFTAGGGGIICTTSGSLVLQQGSQISGGYAGYGGGIYLDGCTATLTDSSVRENVGAVQGGGIHSMGSTLMMSNVSVVGNSVGGFGGGGMYVNTTSTVSLNAVRFTGNVAPAGQGGGLYAQRITIANSLFDQNAARAGGAASVYDLLLVVNTTFSDNSAAAASCTAYAAGGTHLLAGTFHQANNITMLRNRGGMGAAWLLQPNDLVNTAVSAQLINVRVVGSGCGAAVAVVGTAASMVWQGGEVAATDGVGGGIYLISQAQATITGTTIRDNNANGTLLNTAAGITCMGCTLTLGDTFVENNTAAAGLLGAGFACKTNTVVPVLNMDPSTMVFRGNLDGSYPGLEGDFSACGGCSIRAALGINPYARLTVNATGAGCAPATTTAVCAYQCPSLVATATSFTCTVIGISPVTACLLPNTCPLLVAGLGQIAVQPNPAGNCSVATFVCTDSTYQLSDNDPRTCNPPSWVPSTIPTCDKIKVCGAFQSGVNYTSSCAALTSTVPYMTPCEITCTFDTSMSTTIYCAGYQTWSAINISCPSTAAPSSISDGAVKKRNADVASAATIAVILLLVLGAGLALPYLRPISIFFAASLPCEYPLKEVLVTVSMVKPHARLKVVGIAAAKTIAASVIGVGGDTQQLIKESNTENDELSCDLPVPLWHSLPDGHATVHIERDGDTLKFPLYLESRKNAANGLVILSTILEFIQLCAVTFSPYLPWPPSDPVPPTLSKTLAIFYVPNAWRVVFWVVVVLIVIWLIFIALIVSGKDRVIAEKFSFYKSLETPVYCFVLPIIGSSLYLTFLSVLVSAVACSRPDVPNYASLPPSLTVVNEITCWTGEHWTYAIVALVMLVIFMPVSIYMLPVWQVTDEGLDIRYFPRFLLINGEVKAVLIVVTGLFSSVAWLQAVTTFVLILPMLAYVIKAQPAVITAMKWVLTASYLGVLMTSIASMVALLAPGNIAASAVLYSGWAVALIVLIASLYRHSTRQPKIQKRGKVATAGAEHLRQGLKGGDSRRSTKELISVVEEPAPDANKMASEEPNSVAMDTI